MIYLAYLKYYRRRQIPDSQTFKNQFTLRRQIYLICAESCAKSAINREILNKRIEEKMGHYYTYLRKFCLFFHRHASACLPLLETLTTPATLSLMVSWPQAEQSRWKPYSYLLFLLLRLLLPYIYMFSLYRA